MTTYNHPRFAPVAPIQILNALLDKEAFGNYHLFLAHHVSEKAGAFRQLMVKAANSKGLRYTNQTIIMDNSIVELGGAVDDKMIRFACEVVLSAPGEKTRYIVPVLPDVMGIGKDTLKLSSEAYRRWEGDMPGDFMLVTQGNSYEDFTQLLHHFFVEHLADYPRIGWVGIPRKLLPVFGTRQIALQYIRMVAPHVKIHLLGFSDNIVDDILTARFGGVTGIDSAVPCRYDGTLYPTTAGGAIGPRQENWMEEGLLKPWHLRNIQNVRKWVES